jgi:hypothetical protein
MFVPQRYLPPLESDDVGYLLKARWRPLLGQNRTGKDDPSKWSLRPLQTTNFLSVNPGVTPILALPWRTSPFA